MNDALEQALRDSTAGLTLHRPVSDVLERGDRLRRRRTRRLAGAGATIAVAATTGVSLVWPTSTSVLVPKSDAMAWGPQLVNLSPAEVQAAGKVCSDLFANNLGWDVPADTAPLAADSRGDMLVLFYRLGDEYGDCTLRRGDGQLRPSGNSHNEWKKLPAGTHFSFLLLQYSTGNSNGLVRDGLGAGQVSDQVARVDVQVAGQTLRATVENGVAMFWLPQGISQKQADETTLKVYDIHGELLESGPLNTDW